MPRREPFRVEHYQSLYGVRLSRRLWRERYGTRVTFGTRDGGFTLTIFLQGAP